MRKKIICIIIACLLFGAIASGYYLYTHEDKITVAIVPLDSRPCNTRYPYLLGQMADMRVILPPAELLDDYLSPADKDGLWQWLENTSAKCDYILLCTNELFQGGLINSRSSDSLQDLESDLARLQNFCQSHPEPKITVLSILPRLLPSQYDSDLAPYMDELKKYGIAWDQAAQSGIEPSSANVPDEVLAKYRSLFLQSEQMLDKLYSLAASGSIELVVGQDDGAQFCPSNIITRNLQNKQTANVTFLHGADELEMLILASYLDLPTAEVNIIIEDEDTLNAYFPYEAADLKTVLAEKLAFANININEEATDSIFIHTKTGDDTAVALYLAGEHAGYTAIADIATTNRGDKALAPLLLDKDNFAALHCYSGWNTCSNTLGTVLAHYRFSQAFAQNKTAARAAVEFKAVRFGEDAIFQALISPDLRSELAQKGLMNPSTTAFLADASEITPYLASAYEPYANQLQNLFNGTIEIVPNYSVNINNFTSTLTFPWDRAFEVKVECEFQIK